MLRPQDGPTRERKSLNGLWRFRLDPAGEGRDAAWWRRPLADARDMPVPASYNDIPADAAVRDHVGDAWYQTVVRVPRGWAGQRVVLRFDAATHRAEAQDDALPRPAARHPHDRLVPGVADVVADRCVGGDVVVAGRHRHVPRVGERPAPPAGVPAFAGRVEAEAPEAVEVLALAGGAVLGAQHGWQ